MKDVGGSVAGVVEPAGGSTKVEVEERVLDFNTFSKECFWKHQQHNNWCGIIHKKCSAYKCPFVKRIIASKRI